MGVVAKRSSMTYFSDGSCHYCHRVRIVLAEKGVTYDTVEVSGDDKPEELLELNPYNSVPTLVDRGDLVLYESKVMMEYLDERFPHPPLLPVYPVARGASRQLLYRIERDWCPLVDQLMAEEGSADELELARKTLRESLLGIAPIFDEKPFFMSEEFSLVDCVMAPILWRFREMGIELPKTKQGKALTGYMERLFKREAFLESLSDREKSMGSPV